ncbi:MAG: Carboxymethylenebutenolidase [Alphaproteobacteria bacterium MarineAlpha11_Bin1]|nr:MAG: Carboxymethylenebutenolidase [Alphaproteobacteria bacterium MarineAlpha11_Bin1]|tara:strand:+ start:3755 stop:4459 length:705 start_codon:yes stop_codon:yes gene_type:complete
MSNISIDSADGSGDFSAYCAMPPTGSGPGIVVIQEIFGVNQVIRDLCDGFASNGYIAIAPDIFWRIEPGVQLTDKSQAEWDKAFELMNAFLPNFEKGVGDIGATISHVRNMEACNGKVGAVGYCLGGSLAYATACFTDADACSGYYPVQIEDSLDLSEGIKNPLILHVAENDGFCPPDAQAKIKEKLAPNPNITIYSYPDVDHAFSRVGGDNYDEGAAMLANDRTSKLFESILG